MAKVQNVKGKRIITQFRRDQMGMSQFAEAINQAFADGLVIQTIPSKDQAKVDRQEWPTFFPNPRLVFVEPSAVVAEQSEPTPEPAPEPEAKEPAKKEEPETKKAAPKKAAPKKAKKSK